MTCQFFFTVKTITYKTSGKKMTGLPHAAIRGLTLGILYSGSDELNFILIYLFNKRSPLHI